MAISTFKNQLRYFIISTGLLGKVPKRTENQSVYMMPKLRLKKEADHPGVVGHERLILREFTEEAVISVIKISYISTLEMHTHLHFYTRREKKGKHFETH
jgi:hypothetical protein